jgi:ribokinase
VPGFGSTAARGLRFYFAVDRAGWTDHWTTGAANRRAAGPLTAWLPIADRRATSRGPQIAGLPIAGLPIAGLPIAGLPAAGRRSPGCRPPGRACVQYGSVVDLRARLTVFGSLNMDISVTVPDLPGPGATVLGGGAAFAPGGKGANQAVAAARLSAGTGLAVRMVGCVGDDGFGRTLRAALTAEGVDDGAVRAVPGAPTGIAMITVDQAGENMITVAPGANRAVGAPDVAAAVTPAAAPAPSAAAAPAPSAASVADGAAAVLVISAEIPVPAIRAALAAPGAGDGERALTVLNLAPAPPEAAALVAAGPDWLVVNESEAAAVLGRPVSGLAAAARAAADLVAAGARNAVVTAGAAGAAYRDQQAGGGTVPAFPVLAVDTVGAGDTFVGALAVALAAGIAPREAVTAASAAGATAAARPGTQAGMPRPADIRAVTGYEWPLPVTL